VEATGLFLAYEGGEEMRREERGEGEETLSRMMEAAEGSWK
jgi:hypothetical protein